MKKIFFLVPYPVHCSPSQRFRFEQYFPLLVRNGIRFRVSSFLNEGNWRLFYGNASARSKTAALVGGIIRRMRNLFEIGQYDYIFIHREAMPVGPAFFEWIIAKVLKKNIIYDFDDAIWLPDGRHESWLMRTIKWRSKVRDICRWSYKVSCGNAFLTDYAAKFNRNVICNPTIVDTDNYHNPERYNVAQNSGAVTIGWTGSHSTLKYLDMVARVLKAIVSRHKNVEVLIIADRPPAQMSGTPFTFVEWHRDTEVNDLMQIDIGIMPLPDDEWARGKCGFKAIQYMALGIPAIVSPVGMNNKLVTHGVDGFIAGNDGEWHEYLSVLIADGTRRKSMGKNARRKIIDQYSTAANERTFLSLFE